MSKKFLIFLFIFLYLKQLVWTALVPLWHFPDEQAHFAQAAFMVEKGVSPGNTRFDLTEEIRISENLLGTERDIVGNNRFTFHPDYKIEYAPGLVGISETKIQELAKDLQHRQMKKNEASRYPPLYYFFIAIIYKIFYFHDLFFRVFTGRIFQLIFYTGTAYTTFHTLRLLFGKKSELIIPALLLVIFHPMFSFVSAGINSDNISNFIFSLFLYISLKFLKGTLKIKYFLELVLITLLSLYVKPQFYITIPVIFLVVLYKLLSGIHKKAFKLGWSILILILFLLMLSCTLSNGLGAGIIINKFLSVYSLNELIKHFIFYALPHLYREVLPWYWGVFDWLGVTYPRYVHRGINWIVLISILGFIIFLFRNLKKINIWPINGIIYLVFINIVFFMGVYLFDWVQYAASGYKYHLGVQGRYFFPFLISHMTFIVIGWNEIFRLFPVVKTNALNLLIISINILHWYAVYIVANTYYELSSFNAFILQASQYKPWYFKGIWLLILIMLSLTLNLVFLLKYLRKPQIYDQKVNSQS